MSLARPTVSVQNPNGAQLPKGTKPSVKLPWVFTAPIRVDVVSDVSVRLRRNHRQAYAVNKYAGHQVAAESWGTGRAVARIPRISGGGTSRSGQGAFGNMCRGGRRFAPTKTWRRWHRHVNRDERRFATVSALAASALTPLVTARGHRIQNVSEIPLVVETSAVEAIKGTKQANQLLTKLGVATDIERVAESRHINSGKGKLRNRRYTQRVGPLIVYDKKADWIRNFRNIPGVELLPVSALNLLRLAPGGHLGRLIIWTRAAFEQLEKIFGNYKAAAELKKGFRLPQAQMANPDLARILMSDQIQAVVRPRVKVVRKPEQKRNPLKNAQAMVKLNPLAAAQTRQRYQAEIERKKRREAKQNEQRKLTPKQQQKQKNVDVASKQRRASEIKLLKLDRKIKQKQEKKEEE